MSTVPVSSSASYATEVARLLWPEPWEAPYVTRDRHRGGLPHRDAYVFPNERNPRMLVPADVPGSSRMLRRLGGGSRLMAPVRGILERSVHGRAFALTRWPILRVPGADTATDSIEHHLAECFGTEIRVGVLLGTRRANQKPVLQVFDAEGRVLGYAKVGHNDLTAALVRGEAEALAKVQSSQPRSFQAPVVLQLGQWAGLEVLVITALRSDARHRVDPATRLAAMREIARLSGTTTATLVDSGFWARLRADAQRLSGGPRSARLIATAGAIENAHGDQTLQLGSWHGDWGFWNMGMDRGVLQLWDWERFATGVPMGFDGVHYAAQRVQLHWRDARRRERELVRDLHETLGDFEVDTTNHDLTLQLYLLAIALRYEDALSHGPLPSLERRSEWVLSLLERLLAQSKQISSKGRP